MRRVLRDEASHERLVAAGWTELPPLPGEALALLRAAATDLNASLARHAASSDSGFDELWGNTDEAVRRSGQARIAEAMGLYLESTFVDHRAVLFNLFTKRARADRSVVRFHQDFAMIDERGGDAALQLWIPLVDTTPENGALVVVEGSHRDAAWLRPHDTRHPLYGASLTDLPAGAVSLALRAGHGVAFTNRTAHGSPPNRTARERLAIGAVVVPQGAPLVHCVRRDDGSVEVWSFSDDDLAAFQPGWFPPSARLVETVSPPDT
ncbi:MAG TPA: phytanoyl-CoA dioxygenase family protein [Polyangiaceae bacterium]